MLFKPYAYACLKTNDGHIMCFFFIVSSKKYAKDLSRIYKMRPDIGHVQLPPQVLTTIRECFF